MSYGECPNPRPDCKYAPECFSDNDHLIPRRLGATALKRAYLNLPQFQEQVCRREHEERNARHDKGLTDDIPEFPSKDEMRAAIRDAIESGEVSMPPSLQKRLNLRE